MPVSIHELIDRRCRLRTSGTNSSRLAESTGTPSKAYIA
jgi:hypothetical protein